MSVIIEEELRIQMGLLVDDIKEVYNNSGKRVSGEFENDLEVVYTDTSAILKGNLTLAGRVAGKMPPIESIKKWILNRGITPVKQDMSITSLAWAIAKSIAKNGTKESNHLKIYEEVITPQRIDKIIKAVSIVNATWIVSELQAEMQILTQNK